MFLPLALVLGCGPSTPAESPAPTATATAEPAATTSAEAKPAETAPTAAAVATAAPEAKPLPPVIEPPNVAGTIGGKEFKPKAAITMGPLSEGRVLIALTDYEAACEKSAEITEGARSLTMQIEWKPGEVAFAGDKKAKGAVDPSLAVKGKDKMKRTPFVSKGKIELAAAPKEVGKSTRMKLDLASAKDTVKGDIELHVCWEIKEEAKP